VSVLALPDSPGILVRLSEVMAEAPAGHEPVPGFEAWVEGPFVDGSLDRGPHRVGRVLERTAVREVADQDRRLARRDAVLVDPGQVEWQLAEERTRLAMSRRWLSPGSDPASVRERSDRRALASRDGQRQRRTPPAAANAGGASGRAPRPQAVRAESDRGPGAAGDLEELIEDDPSRIEAPAATPAVSAGLCGRCGRALPSRNRSGLCTSCQRVCPECGGPKSIPASRCGRCHRPDHVATSERDSSAEASDSLVALLEQLPEEAREPLLQLIGLLVRQQELSAELARHRAAERRIRRVDRRLRSALGAPAIAGGSPAGAPGEAVR
jgi:hypothetical protein